MPQRRKLARPPIVEALVDIHIARAPIEPDLAALQGLADIVRDRFPNVDVRRKISGRFERGQAGLTASVQDAGLHGVVSSTETGDFVVQFRPDGLTVSQLKGYSSADYLFGEAMALWQRYFSAVRPGDVSRVGLRYINQFTIPLEPGQRISDFLIVVPTLPPALPQGVAGFLQKITARADYEKPRTVVTQQLKGGPGNPLFILDIDSIHDRRSEPDETSLRAILAELRELKNDFFFEMLTDETLRLFE